MKHLVLLLSLLFVDDMPPISPPTPPAPTEPTPPPVTPPVEPTPPPVIPPAPPVTPPVPPPMEMPETEAQAKAKQVFVNEVRFCQDWFANLTNDQFYMKWNSDKFSKLNKKEKAIFFLQEAGQLETRARKVSRSLDTVVKSASFNGADKVAKEATKLYEEIEKLREELATKRAEMLVEGIRQYPDIANGLKLQLKLIANYYDKNTKEPK